MARGNAEIVREAIDAFNRRDLDAAGRDFDAEAVVDWSESRGVEARIYSGRRAIQSF